MSLDHKKNPEVSNKITRREIIFGLLACTLTPKSTIAQTPAEIQAAVSEALRELPYGSQLESHAQTNPEFRADLEDVVAYYRQAERNDQTPPRSPAQFEQVLNRVNATMRRPENTEILENFSEAKQNLLGHLEEGQVGLFIDGQNRHLYVVKKQNGTLQATIQMDVTVSRHGFSNEINSGGSPYGEMWISSIMEGRIGEALLHNDTRYYSNGDIVNNVNRHATITTGRASISDRRADHRLAQRGVALHGTNVGFNDRGELQSNLAASAGCYRLADGDITYLLLKHIKRNINESAQNGTPMYVSRTSEVNAIQSEINTADPPLAKTEVNIVDEQTPDPTIGSPIQQPSIDPDAAFIIRLN